MTKEQKKDALVRETAHFIRCRYPMAIELATVPRRAAQNSSFASWQAWLTTVWDTCASAVQQANDAADDAAAELVTIDFDLLASTDPNLRLADFIRL